MKTKIKKSLFVNRCSFFVKRFYGLRVTVHGARGTRYGSRLFLTLFCFLFFFLNKVSVQSAVISAFKGKVEILKKQDKNWVPAKVNMSLGEGDKIRTFNKSSCVIKLSSYETIKLAAFTTFAISELKKSPQENTKLKVWGGKIYTKVKKTLKPGSSFKVQSPTAIAGVRSTEFSVNVLGEEKTDISCTKGIVSVENTPYTPGVVVKKIELMPFQKTTVLKDNLPEEPKAMTEEEKKNESEEQKNIESAKLIEETTANLYLVLDNGDEEIETEEEEIKISGVISDVNAELKIENEKVEIDKEGKFEKTIKLKEGGNEIKVFAKNKDGVSTSKTIKVNNKGKAKGFLKIEFPKDGYKTNNEEIETIGKIHPQGTLTINGEEVEISKNGEFKYKITLTMGENTLTYVVKAVNKEVSKTIKVIRGTPDNEVAEDIVIAIFSGVIKLSQVQGIITKEEYKILKLKGKLGTIIFIPQGIDEEFPQAFTTLDSTINYLKDAQIIKQAEGFVLTTKNGKKYEVKVNVCK